MTSAIRLRRALAAAVAGLVAACAPAPVAAAEPAPPTVPGTIVVEEGHKVFLVGHAVGVQIHACNGFAWGFVGPRATLYDDAGKLVTTHFGGPSWQARDGSKAVGSLVDKVTVDPTAIPWLLLSAKGSAGPDGDRLAGTTFIQRIATTGGLAPAPATCTAANAGAVEEVPYTADYFFWKRKVA